MEDKSKYDILREPLKLKLKLNRSMIKWIASDGKTFYNAKICEAYDKPLRRQMMYDHLMSKRNWFERLFNMKPDMGLYDRLDG